MPNATIGSVRYMYLKTKNYCWKTFVEIRVNKKICENTLNIV